MQLLIFGATGKTGVELVKQALDQQHEVTAFVRNPDKLEFEHKNLKIVQGDITDYEQVEKNVQGKDVIISALGPTTLLKRVPEITEGIRHIVKAMETHAVKRLIYISALGVGDSKKGLNPVFRYFILPVFLGRAYADHEANEQIIRYSKPDWIIVRPAGLGDGPRSGDYQVVSNLEGISQTDRINRADVADFMLRQLSDNGFVHKTPALLGV